MSSKIKIMAGGLLASGLAVLLYPLIFMAYSSYTSEVLREKANQLVHPAVNDQGTADLYISQAFNSTAHGQSGLFPPPAPALTRKPAIGELIGKLSIPALHLDTAILEGTDQAELAEAPGHLTDSVYPGQIGKSILAAHNISTFHTINTLKPGTLIIVTTEQGRFTYSVTDQRILKVSDPLPETAYPALALETCYPLDALYSTNQRLFVEAALVKSE